MGPFPRPNKTTDSLGESGSARRCPSSSGYCRPLSLAGTSIVRCAARLEIGPTSGSEMTPSAAADRNGPRRTICSASSPRSTTVRAAESRGASAAGEPNGSNRCAHGRRYQWEPGESVMRRLYGRASRWPRRWGHCVAAHSRRCRANRETQAKRGASRSCVGRLV